MDASNPGLAIVQAKERKRCTYPEFGQQGRRKLVVLAPEVGGHGNTATKTSLRGLAVGECLPRPYHPALHGPMLCKAAGVRS